MDIEFPNVGCPDGFYRGVAWYWSRCASCDRLEGKTGLHLVSIEPGKAERICAACLQMLSDTYAVYWSQALGMPIPEPPWP